MKLKLGTVVYRSERGHKGFYYPVRSRSLTLSSAVEVRSLTWVGGGPSLRPLYALGDVSAFDGEGHYHHFGGVFWISKEDLFDSCEKSKNVCD